MRFGQYNPNPALLQRNRGAMFKASAVSRATTMLNTFRASAGILSQFKYTFGAIYLFTLALYTRPNDLFPIGDFPIVKIIAIIAPIAYIFERRDGKDLFFSRAIESKMIVLLGALGVLFTPIAASPHDSWHTLTEAFFKVIIIFELMLQVVNQKKQLRSLFTLVTVSLTLMSMVAVKNYLSGEFTLRGERIAGIVGGMFSNPNDLAIALNMTWPLALVLALTTKEKRKKIFYLVCIGVMMTAIITTFSRGGFISLMAAGGLLAWKLGRGRRISTVLASLLLAGCLLAIMPGNYVHRLLTIVNVEQDETGSAQERQQLLETGLNLAMRHPVIGVGMGNFHIYTAQDKVAHNSYVEIAAELGLIGLIAYLIILFSSMKRMNRIEKEIALSPDPGLRETRYYAIGVQGALMAYAIGSIFASIEYLWYLYYAAFYAITLTTIYQVQKAGVRARPNQSLALVRREPTPQAPVTRPLDLFARKAKSQEGVLWQSKKSRKRELYAASPKRY
jgi:probable O-glycosylation ligase (exosortase A-associated)